MTFMEFFGCTFIAFGPPFGLFVFTIARDPLRIIVLISSGFFWLLALLLSSIWWYAVVPLRKDLAFGLVFSVLFQELVKIKWIGFFWLLALLLSSIWWYAVVPLRKDLAFGLVFSVLFQELFRFFFYKLLRKADEGLQKVSQQEQDQHVMPKDISNKHIMAYVSGLGFGIISGAFSLVNVLADMAGPGTIGIHGDSQYFFLASAFLTLCFILLHTFWGIVFFNALDKKRYFLLVTVVLSHMLVSCLSLLNKKSSTHSQQYLACIIPAYVTMFIMGGIAFKVAGGSLANLKNAVMCSRSDRYAVE